MSKKAPVTAVIIGAGHRSIAYALYAKKHPDELRIVGVAEPFDVRRRQTAEMFGIPAERCFNSVEELVLSPRFADAAINGTMDQLHVPSTLLLLDVGYDVLLEKPIATCEHELFALLKKTHQTGRKVMICHVLRYAPFYRKIHQKLLADEIGDIMQIHAAECVSYHHMALGYVRGKWNRKDSNNGSSMLLAKSCHDLDLIAWFKGGVAPKKVSSFGGLKYFRPENAPSGSGTRCLVDCKIESVCPYSAKKNYIEQNIWGTYVWHCLEHISNPTLEEKINSLKVDNPHGRCVWRCDNNVVDHQTVVVEFEDGSVASFDMVGGVSKACRYLHIFGTKGEIQGALEDEYFVIRKPDARKGHEYVEEKIALNAPVDEHGEPISHGGGDQLLVEDFVRFVRNEQPTVSTTNIMDSIHGHQIVFAADVAMGRHATVSIHNVQG